MIFVSNFHILIWFQNKNFVTFHTNGIVLEQTFLVQKYLKNTVKILAESALECNRKYLTVLVRGIEVYDIAITLCFKDGEAKVVTKSPMESIDAISETERIR